MIKTSSWFDRMPPGYVRIGISVGTPRGQHAAPKIMALAPGRSWFRTAGTEEYRARYAAQLSALDPAEIVAEIDAKAQGQTPVLCCFEKLTDPSAWCHRGYVSAWFCLHLGLVVPELTDPSGAYGGDHPLLPKEYRRQSVCKQPAHAELSLFSQ